MSDPLTSLVKKMDETLNRAASKHPRKLGAFVILPDGPGRVDRLRSLAAKEALQRVTLSIGAPTPRYEISQEAAVTVVIYNPGRPGQQSVQANFALMECGFDETATDEIIAALVRVLPK
jgi:hypothetical protein